MNKTLNIKVFFLLIFSILFTVNIYAQSISLIEQLKKVDELIDRRDYPKAKQLLDNVSNTFNNKSPIDNFAIDLRVVKIKYFGDRDDDSINILLDNLQELNILNTIRLQYEYNSFLGQAFKSAKNFEKSILYYQQALTNAEKRKDTLDVIFSCLKIGSCFYRVRYIDTPKYYKNEPDSALFYFNKALTFPENKKTNKLFTRVYDNVSRIEATKGNVERAEKYANMALKINKEINNSFGIAVSLNNLSRAYFLKKDYQKSIECAEQSNTFIKGKSRSIYRDNLEWIAKNYQKLKDYKKANTYLEETYKVSQVIAKNTLERDVNEIETKYNVVKAQQKALQEKNRRLQIQMLLYTALILIVILIASGTILYRRNRRYKKRFKKLMAENGKATVKTTKPISLKKVKHILDGLEAFESNKSFLSQNVSLNEVAKKLETNSNYLSKVVNSYKNKNFAMYLNELRINHAISELKNNSQLRSYSIEGIAYEFGYKNPQSFSTAFKKITGLYPSYFIKQIQKTKPL